MSRFAALRIIHRIFVVIFLAGMLTTVLNYLPVIEEEVSSKKHELAHKKKTGTNDGAEPIGDDETGSSSEDLFQKPSDFHICMIEVWNRPLGQPGDRYLPPLEDNCTPPPRFLA